MSKVKTSTVKCTCLSDGKNNYNFTNNKIKNKTLSCDQIYNGTKLYKISDLTESKEVVNEYIVKIIFYGLHFYDKDKNELLNDVFYKNCLTENLVKITTGDVFYHDETLSKDWILGDEITEENVNYLFPYLIYDGNLRLKFNITTPKANNENLKNELISGHEIYVFGAVNILGDLELIDTWGFDNVKIILPNGWVFTTYEYYGELNNLRYFNFEKLWDINGQPN